ncbi:electron transport complex subunit RsxC [Stutzerimonas tarimensis]|uniref:Ion-translocating oxidoreductase complex subunit C n=1 Tax=Stutzerimonas tarimensis TaxID=1507735 RepID=A0ABV7T5W7_9GAMM
MFNLSRIRGGVHPAGHKDRSAALSIAQLPLAPRLFLPLRQHAGAEALPLVRPGDYVLKGQLLAASPSEVSAPVHAPSSGRILELGPIAAPHPSGLLANGFVLECDGEDRWIDLDPPEDPFAVAPEVLANRVAEAGVVGLGGAIFPAAVKLRQGAKHEIKTVLVNGSECEPYLTCDDRLMRERAAAIVDGARLIQHILRAYGIVIAIEDNKPAALAAMRAAAEPFGAVEVQAVPALYPMGSAKQLIREVTGREVPAGGRSTDVGVLVHNAGTVYAIQQALRHGRPLISRVITVAGSCVSGPRNIEALIGTPAQQLLDACGGLVRPPEQLLLGGPMMGVVLPSAQVPVIKGATGLLALGKHELPRAESSPCIRCARCVDACPMGLTPLEMAAHARVDDFDGASQSGLKDCILCGCCSYVCPSHIPLVQYFQYASGQLDERRAAARKTEHIKQMSEARAARLAEEEAAKAAAKAAKKRKAKPANEVES